MNLKLKYIVCIIYLYSLPYPNYRGCVTNLQFLEKIEKNCVHSQLLDSPVIGRGEY